MTSRGDDRDATGDAPGGTLELGWVDACGLCSYGSDPPCIAVA
jgi:hypothetical protein